MKQKENRDLIYINRNQAIQWRIKISSLQNSNNLLITKNVYNIFYKMKSTRLKIVFIFAILFLFQLVTSQQASTNETATQQQNVPQPTPPDHTIIDLDKPYQQQLDKDSKFSAKYRINISQSKVKQLKQEKWYFFIEVETAEQFEWEKTKIQLFSINDKDNQRPLKQCDTTSGLDSCFLTNNNFDYKTQMIEARVTCEEDCKFTISAEISQKYKLIPNEPLEMNFQNTAYSKLFQLNTLNIANFRKLQIILKPTGFLSFDAPIRLYANRGESIPTRQKHDYAGIHLWDDGLGIFINYPDASNLFTILIEGPQKNILTLQATIITDYKPVSTISYKPYFGYLQSQQTQQYQVDINKTQHTYIKLTTITGSIQLYRIKDESNKTITIDFTPLSRSYGQLSYKFQPSFFQRNKQYNIKQHIYVEIKANKDSTFVFQSYTDNQQLSHLVPEVNRYSQFEGKSTDMYYLKVIDIDDNVNKSSNSARIEIMTTTYSDVDMGTKMFLCKSSTVKDCQPTKQQIQKLKNNQTIDNQKRKSLKNVPLDVSIPGVKYYDLQINYKQFMKTQGVYYIYVIIVLINPVQQQILYTLQYIDLGSTYFLKQKELKRDRLSIDQIKYYTFINNDDDVKTIKIHSTQISGDILMVGYREDPRSNQVEGKQIYQYHGSVTYLNVKKGDQIYLEVQGLQSAYYSLYLQLIRDSQNKTDQKSQDGYNEIVIQENTPYDFFIKPNEKIIVQMVSTVPEFQLVMGSHLPLDLCMTEVLDSPPFEPNCEIVQTLTKNQRLNVKMDKGLVGNVGITNNNNKSVQFKIQMRNRKVRKQCAVSAINILNSWQIKASTQQAPQSSCYRFYINRRQSFQLIVELQNMQYDNATISWHLNDKQKQIMMGSRHLIWKKELIKICGENQSDKCELTVKIVSNYSTTAKAVVQFIDKDLILIDGIAQPSWSRSNVEEPKYFRYELINFVDTTIVLQNKASYFHFYGSIVPKIDFYAKGAQRNSLYPTQKSNLFKSANPLYNRYQVYTLTAQQIKKSNCTTECVLLLTVLPETSSQYPTSEEPGRFTIQVSQQDRFLKESEPMMGYLQRESLAFYEFYNPKKGTIFIQLNNQNMNCAKMYIKKGNSIRATPSAYDKMTDTQNSLILEDAQQGSYGISLQAKRWGCSYTITAMSSSIKVSKIKRGVFTDKVMQANQTVYLLYDHFKNQSFKILTLSKTGEVMIKLKVLNQGQLNKLLSVNDTNKEEFLSKLVYQSSNTDFLKVHHNKDLFFCFDCTYLVSVTGIKYTQTSIVIPAKHGEVPIVADSLIKDEVKMNQTTKYRIFTSNLAQYKIYVQYGKVNVTITQSIENKVVISKVYEQTKEPVYQKFNASVNFNDSAAGYGYDFVHYSIVQISGLANSSFYSFELLSTEDKQQHGGNVKYGIPEYFYLQPKQPKCFKGMLNTQSEQFILSFEGATKQQVEKIQITCKVNDKKTNYTLNYAVNEMTLEINDLKISEPTPYELCFSSKQMIGLTFIQSAHIMLLPSDTSVLITHPTNMTLGSKGMTLLEIDQCAGGKSIVSVSSTFNDLHTTESQVNLVRRGNGIAEFYFWGPVYVHLQTNGSRIRWRNKDQYKQEGVGYQKFTSATAVAFKDGQNLRIQVKPLEQVSQYNKKASMTVNMINYKIILAKSEKELRSALSCTEGDVFRYEFKTTDISIPPAASFKIDENMRNKFKEGKYFFAGVQASLCIDVNSVMQNYRFIYPMVDIQKQVLYGGQYQRPYDIQINKQQGSGIGGTLLIILGVIVFVVSWVYIYKKWIRKCLRRKGRLADQGESGFKYSQFASMD